MISQTLTNTETRTITLADVRTVSRLVSRDLERIIRECNVNLRQSLKCQRNVSEEELLRLVETNLQYFLQEFYVDRITFGFYRERRDGTLDGHLLTYRADYVVEQTRTVRAGGQPIGQPLAFPGGLPKGRFLVMVHWDDRFMSQITEGEKRIILSGAKLGLKWINPPQLYGQGLNPQQRTAEYAAGYYRVTRFESGERG